MPDLRRFSEVMAHKEKIIQIYGYSIMNEIMQYRIAELQSMRKNLINEFTEADQGIKNSIAFVKHNINLNNQSLDNRAQVLVIGGSNLISCLIEKKDKNYSIQNIEKKKLPIFTTKDILLDLIIDHLIPDINRMAINFAYPLIPVYRDNKLDGKLLKGTKEHTFDGLIDLPIGFEAEKYIYAKKGKKIDIFVANDTLCLILSGLEKSDPINIVGGVVGTGFNFGFFLHRDVIVNLESGNFNKFQISDSSAYIDRHSNNPGSQLWEKEVSGAYLYQHYNYYIDLIGKKPISNTKELSLIASGKNDEASIAQEIFKRSASLVAVEIAAIYDYKNKMNLHVYIEGSLFWEGWEYHTMVCSYLEKLGISLNSIKISKIEQSNIFGAAQLVL